MAFKDFSTYSGTPGPSPAAYHYPQVCGESGVPGTAHELMRYQSASVPSPERDPTTGPQRYG